MAKTKRLRAYHFLGRLTGILERSLILNIENLDFGFVSYFEFRASNFLVFSPLVMS